MGISRVFMICNSYETGFGDAVHGKILHNPYKPGSDEAEAYNIGYNAGIESIILDDDLYYGGMVQ